MSIIAALFGMALAEQTVIVPDQKPFTVTQDQIVRLVGSGAAGCQITANIQGPARVQTESVLSEYRDGRPKIGAHVREFDIRQTGLGKVTVTITINFRPDIPPQTIIYTYEVK